MMELQQHVKPKNADELLAWLNEKPERRGKLVGWFMSHLQSPASIDEVMTALVLAVRVLGYPGGERLAQRIKQLEEVNGRH